MKSLLRILKRLMIIALAVLIGSWLLACGLLYAKQTAMLYPGPTQGGKPQWKNAQWLELPGPDGKKVHAVYIPAAPGQRTVVHFHGNGEELSGQSFLALPFEQEGLGFLAVEYPGYGLSKDEGVPSEKTLYAAAETALRYLRDELNVPNEQTVLSGWSLGSGVATELATRGFGSRLILVSAYTSITETATRMFPIIPVRLLANDRYETEKKAPGVKVPVLLVHGTKDNVIPFDMGQTLSKTFPNATFIRVEGASHNDVYREHVIASVIAFARAD